MYVGIVFYYENGFVFVYGCDDGVVYFYGIVWGCFCVVWKVELYCGVLFDCVIDGDVFVVLFDEVEYYVEL